MNAGNDLQHALFARLSSFPLFVDLLRLDPTQRDILPRISFDGIESHKSGDEDLESHLVYFSVWSDLHASREAYNYADMLLGLFKSEVTLTDNYLVRIECTKMDSRQDKASRRWRCALVFSALTQSNYL